MNPTGADVRAAIERELAEAGGTDFDYLSVHFARFLATRREFVRRHGNRTGSMLDIGAHWLHQSLMWALDGWNVCALDVPATFADPAVARLADRHRIRLLRNDRLEHPAALGALADDSVDVVLATEIIEHMAFNPVPLWREIHRVLRPGGRIVVTTPNYYALRGRAWNFVRFVRGRGSGVDVRALIAMPTFAHHWKEYSRVELCTYFETVSPDFCIERASLVREYRVERHRSPLRRLVMLIEHVVPVLRPGLHVEIALDAKRAGVVGDPGW